MRPVIREVKGGRGYKGGEWWLIYIQVNIYDNIKEAMISISQ